MRWERFGSLVSAAITTGILVFSIGCGSDSGADDDGLDGGIGQDSGDCLGTGATCTENEECCSGRCENNLCLGASGLCDGLGEPCTSPGACCSGRCEAVPSGDMVCVVGGCVGDGDACTAAIDCCSMSCVDGECSSEGLCAVATEECEEDEDCCSNSCGTDNLCELVGTCLTSGELCGDDTPCCSGFCEDLGEDGHRCMPVSSCRAEGDLCTAASDCCSGVCGEDGLCPVMAECQTVGEPCTGFHECCSGLCADPGTGVPVCQTISGCRPIGDICQTAGDCCSGVCEEYETTGIKRCIFEGSCLEPGELCWEGQPANCCPVGGGLGNSLCLPTVLELQRCYSEDTVDECLETGEECSFSDQCCEGFCLPNEEGVFVCNPSCVPAGGVCTNNMDCCEGVCTDGICGDNPTDCVPVGARCVIDEDCCEGNCDEEAGLCLPYIE